MIVSATGVRHALVGLEDSPRHLVAILEQPVQFLVEKPAGQATPQPAERRFVLDLVSQHCASDAIVQEDMPVIPFRARPAHLAAGAEPARRILGTPGNPAKLQRSNANTHDNPAPGTNRLPSFDESDPFPGRCQPLECSRALVEGEYVGWGRRDP